MKKIVMIAAALMLGASVQAASIAWGNASTSLVRDLGGVAISGANAGTYSLVVSLINVTDGTTVATISGSSAVSSMTAGLLAGTLSNYTYGTGAGATGNGDNFYILLTATFSGTAYTMKVFENNANLDYWTIAAADDTGADTFAWTAGTYGGTGVTGDVGKWVAVPEPTSMALLALGVAAIGLRRKFRK